MQIDGSPLDWLEGGWSTSSPTGRYSLTPLGRQPRHALHPFDGVVVSVARGLPEKSQEIYP